MLVNFLKLSNVVVVKLLLIIILIADPENVLIKILPKPPLNFLNLKLEIDVLVKRKILIIK
tara:strand:- start:125 stop:307 length:183 start_codon:yes stop_codon:yes gene_type:complete